MKTFQYLSAGGILISFLIFQGCQNCDDAVAAAQSGFESRLTAVTDSIKGAWKADIDSLRASYEAKINMLDSLIIVKAEASEKKAPKKTSTNVNPKTSKMQGLDKKAQESLQQKKSKMKGK